MAKTVVFVGPSVSLVRARSILNANYLPPIKRGELARLDPDVDTIGIIDGEFFQSLAVSPKEVLPLLDRGVRIFGASSIGALRAVETEAFGMLGIGSIFEWYRDGVVDGDDEVALTYDPTSYRPSSEPLINIRFGLQAAVRENVIQQSKADEIIRTLKQTYFPFRSYQLVWQLSPVLRQFFNERNPDQNRDDALLLLSTITTLNNRENHAEPLSTFLEITT